MLRCFLAAATRGWPQWSAATAHRRHSCPMISHRNPKPACSITFLWAHVSVSGTHYRYCARPVRCSVRSACRRSTCFSSKHGAQPMSAAAVRRAQSSQSASARTESSRTDSPFCESTAVRCWPLTEVEPVTPFEQRGAHCTGPAQNVSHPQQSHACVSRAVPT